MIHNIQQSIPVVDPPSNVDDFFSCYDDVLRLLLDKHAPLMSIVVRRRSQSPWFDVDCRAMKYNTCRLERICRRTWYATDHCRWKKQLDHQRSFIQSKYSRYWSSAVSDCKIDATAKHSGGNSTHSFDRQPHLRQPVMLHLMPAKYPTFVRLLL